VLPFAVLLQEVPPLFLPDISSSGSNGSVFKIRLDSGGQLTYGAFDTSERYWKASKDWANTGPYDQDAAVRRIIDAIEQPAPSSAATDFPPLY
jgi:hypothetical protein